MLRKRPAEARGPCHETDDTPETLGAKGAAVRRDRRRAKSTGSSAWAVRTPLIQTTTAARLGSRNSVCIGGPGLTGDSGGCIGPLAGWRSSWLASSRP
jgi:hypothetical protein